MVHDQVDDDPDAALGRRVGELDEIAQGAVARIDLVVVGNIVCRLLLEKKMEWHEPDRRDAQSLEIVETAHQAFEVTDPVAVGVHVGADGEAIDDGVLVPQVVDHTVAGGPVSSTMTPSSERSATSVRVGPSSRSRWVDKMMR